MCPFVATLVFIGGVLLEQQPPVFGFGCVFGLELTLDGCVELPSTLLGPEQHEPPVLAVVSGGVGAGFAATLAFPEQQEPPFVDAEGAGMGAGFGVLAVGAALVAWDIGIVAPAGNMGPGICCGNIGYIMGWWKPPLTPPIIGIEPYSIPGLGVGMPCMVPFTWGMGFA